MPRLLAILPKNGLAVPGIRANQLSQIVIGAPGAMQDWRFHLQGPSILFESPSGWKPGKRCDDSGERYVYSLPRADFYFQWMFDAEEEVREPINHSTPAPADALAKVIELETAAANAKADADDARPQLYRAGDEPMQGEVVGVADYAPVTVAARVETEPEVADPDDSDDLPMPPAKKGKQR